jgi:WD40 repeat protein
MRKRCLLLVLLGIAGAQGAEPPRDCYGDPLPEGAIARLGSLRLRNEEFIFGAAFTADGKTLAVVGTNNIYFWDPFKGKLVRRVELQAVPVQSRRFSADGKTLIQARQDDPKVLSVLDASSGAEQRTLTRAGCLLIQHLDVSRDGKIVAVVHENTIVLWDVPSGKLLHRFSEPPPLHGAVALAPDGKQLVVPHSDGSLHVVDVASGKELRAVEMPPLPPGRPSPRTIQRLAISPDGRYLVFGGPDTPLTLCELATGKRLHELAPSQSNFFTGAAFTPDSRLLAVDEYTGIRLFEVPSGKEVRKLPLKSPKQNRLVFSPDGRMLAAVEHYTIQLWDMTANRWLHPPVGHEAQIEALHFFPDGKRLVSADRGREMRVWDIASAQTLAQRMSNAPAVSLTVDKDGESVRFTTNYHVSAHHWDPRTGRDEVQPRGSIGLSGTTALSPDGRSLAVLTNNASSGDPKKSGAARQLRLYDLKTSKWIALPGLPELPQWGLHQVLFAPDSRRLAARCPNGVLLLWDRDTGKLVRELKMKEPGGGQPLHLVFAADGRSFLAAIGRMIRIRELASGADRLQNPPVPGFGYGLAYAPDARYFACGQEDGRILVYSAISGKQLAQWQGKQGSVRALAFSRDGRLLASGGANGTILIWKVPEDDSVPVVRNAEEAVSLWQTLGDSDAAAANRALAGLAAAPAQTLPLFKERLRPLGKPLDREQLARRIAELEDDSFKVREQATCELALLGDEAADALRQALHNDLSAEAKRRIEDLLSRLKKGGDPERLHFLRALEVLERIGTRQATALLHELERKPLPAELHEDIEASLRRIEEREPPSGSSSAP